jgi:hypothetical protein
MTHLSDHQQQLPRNTNTKTTTAATIFVACSTLLIALVSVTILGGSNHIIPTVNAQLVDAEELREDLRAAIVEEKLEKVVNQNQNQSNQSNAASSSNGLTLSLDRAHFIPLSPLSDSPGNQVKLMLGYSVQNSSTLFNDEANAVMEVYASNQTLLRTSSLPEPLVLDNPEGSIQLASTFDDPALQNVTVRALLTDGQKILPLSDPIEASLGLGEIKPEAVSSELK